MSQDQKQTIKRSQYFIKKGFQTSMILKFVLLLIVMAIVSSLMLYFFAGSKLESSYYEAHSSIKSMWDILGPTVLASNLISLIVITIATIYLILFISHKIAGPLYKLEKNINEISEGNMDLHLKFREGDQIKTLGDALQNMVDSFSGRISSMKRISEEITILEERLDAVKETDSVSGNEIDEIHERLMESSKKLNDELNSFKLKS